MTPHTTHSKLQAAALCEACGRAIHPAQIERANEVCDAIGVARFTPAICDPCVQRQDPHVVVNLNEYPDGAL